jgi:hypothetical protein
VYCAHTLALNPWPPAPGRHHHDIGRHRADIGRYRPISARCLFKALPETSAGKLWPEPLAEGSAGKLCPEALPGSSARRPFRSTETAGKLCREALAGSSGGRLWREALPGSSARTPFRSTEKASINRKSRSGQQPAVDRNAVPINNLWSGGSARKPAQTRSEFEPRGRL